MRFVARLGVEPPTDRYTAKNTILEVITPDRQAWKQPEQIQRDLTGKPAAGNVAIETATPPANAIARPQWAAGEPMGEISQKEDEWQRNATAAAIAGARKIAAGCKGLGSSTPIGRLTDEQWGWIITAAIFGWIETRVEQAIAESLDQEQTVRLIELSPSPCDVAVVRSILPTLADTAAIDWTQPLTDLVERHDERIAAGRLGSDPQGRDRPRSWTGRDPAQSRTVRQKTRDGDDDPFRSVNATPRSAFVLTLQPLPGVDAIRSCAGF